MRRFVVYSCIAALCASVLPGCQPGAEKKEAAGGPPTLTIPIKHFKGEIKGHWKKLKRQKQVKDTSQVKAKDAPEVKAQYTSRMIDSVWVELKNGVLTIKASDTSRNPFEGGYHRWTVYMNQEGDLPDTDGDGIVDDFDVCPDTPPGTEVDANGCPLTDVGDGRGGWESGTGAVNVVNYNEDGSVLIVTYKSAE